jgi:hypothetical protein
VSVKVHSADETNVHTYTFEAGDHFSDLALVDFNRPVHLESYLTEKHTELLLILKEDFDRLLHRRCFDDLKARYIMLRKLKLFQVRPQGGAQGQAPLV